MQVKIEGAVEHNLRDIDVEFGDGITVVTGVSGSGKTSLVFDTLYHEARRRFLDIFSSGLPGARLAPAKVRSISGIGPTVAVGQDLLNRNPNSTLATASGLHPFFRILFARFGQRSCATCGAELSFLSDDDIVTRVKKAVEHGPLEVTVPLVRGCAGSHRTLLGHLAKRFGSDAIRVDGEPWRGGNLDPAAVHDIDVTLDRLQGEVPAIKIRAALDAASALGAHALVMGDLMGEQMLSRAPVCAGCGTWFRDLEPSLFNMSCPGCGSSGCGDCAGTGLHPEAAAVSWRGTRFTEIMALPAARLAAFFGESGDLPPEVKRLGEEIQRRLDALEQVGLGYLSLDRSVPTLSRGETQRVRLAVCLAGRLEDMLHVLDEPTIGQHAADVSRLIETFRRLPGPVVFVEHDRAAAAAADLAVDLGPGAGSDGGRILFTGTPAGLWLEESITGRHFSLRTRVKPPDRRDPPDEFIRLRGVSLRILRNIDVSIPVGRFSVVTGVSGSGKSTLVGDVLTASLRSGEPAGCLALEGPRLTPVIVDQAPIGRNPRSNPATYTKLADIIRDCFAAFTGRSPSMFSFNRREGACPECAGMGALEIAMRYLPSTWIPCAACGGRRFSDEVLALTGDFGGRRLSIADIYELRIDEVAPPLLEAGALKPAQKKRAARILGALTEAGLGYLTLGQPSPTLSGGEAQRVKLARHLGSRSLAGRLLVLDEPSTGLHPGDVAGLLSALDRLVRTGATIVVVEHDLDVIRAADWVIDLGPGAGEDGGDLLYAGPVDGIVDVETSRTAEAIRREASIAPRSARNEGGDGRTGENGNGEAIHAGTGRGTGDRRSETSGSAPPEADSGRRPGGPFPRKTAAIKVRGARANNLRGVDADFPKEKITVVTGISGSGKSSLVTEVLGTEARRRYLETLTMYERQSTREGPEAPVDSVTGLGVALAVDTARGRYSMRATAGTVTGIVHHLAALLAAAGDRRCTECGGTMTRGTTWSCPACDATAPIAEPRHFTPSTYAAACLECHGIGSFRKPNPSKLIIRPDLPLCGGAMHSPGFFPKGYLCKPFNHGYSMVRALAAKHGFDPETTPWLEIPEKARQAFLFGDPEPLDYIHENRQGKIRKDRGPFPGFFGWIRDWDVGGTYTDTETCPACEGAKLRPGYLAVTLGGFNIFELCGLPLVELAAMLEKIDLIREAAANLSGSDGNGNGRTASTRHRRVLAMTHLDTARRKLDFLVRAGLGYLHIDRPSGSLSAGEVQRIRLAGLLGSGLTSLTLLIDEPTRGLHPSEVEALVGIIRNLRDAGNTVIVVEHDPVVIRAADHVIDMGPGAGAEGGAKAAEGPPGSIARTGTTTGRWLRGEGRFPLRLPRREPSGRITIRNPRANNLAGGEVRLPLGVLTGVCGVSGSGKSTLLIDILGRLLVPRKQTTSVAYEPVEPGAHDAVEGAPARAVLVDQSKAGMSTPASWLGISRPAFALFAAGEHARALGLDEKTLGRRCASCRGSGSLRIDMGFMPDIHSPCETCNGTGLAPEAREVTLRDTSLADFFTLTIDEVLKRFEDAPRLTRPLEAARDTGLGYLALGQPGASLSGGEAQRLKIAKELCRRTRGDTLYILDEPTVGQHPEDVARLAGVLHRLVDEGHSVMVIEHDPHLLAACDRLLELGPGGGPDGGRVTAVGTPEEVACTDTATAPYLAAVLGDRR